jgi:hypothetical protein
METMQWAFFDATSRDMSEAVTTIQQATTSYRPNDIIWKIVRKELELPFEARMSRPFYHMDRPHAFAETFYCSESFALGSVQMTIVDNPNQQMVWSLVAKGTDGPLAFSGGQPMRGSTSGHSPYTQVLQSKGALILMTAPTEFEPKVDTTITPDFPDRMHLWHLSANEQGKNFEARDRQRYGKEELHFVDPPDINSGEDLSRFWNESKGSASSWLYFPRSLEPIDVEDYICFKAMDTYIAVKPLTKEHYFVKPSQQVLDKLKDRQARQFFMDYSLVVFPGKVSGFILESAEARDYSSIDDYVKELKNRTRIKSADKHQIYYRSFTGDDIEMIYNPAGLRCKARIDGEAIDFDRFTEGATYISPFINIKDGLMTVTDGQSGYAVKFVNDRPVWEFLK